MRARVLGDWVALQQNIHPPHPGVGLTQARAVAAV